LYDLKLNAVLPIYPRKFKSLSEPTKKTGWEKMCRICRIGLERQLFSGIPVKKNFAKRVE
jgi:hypothetical protein